MTYDSTTDTLFHIRRVTALMIEAAMQILGRAKWHDDSKLKPPEKEMFDKFTPLLRASEYGSPEYKETLAEMGVALQHHYKANLHHPEHYPNGVNGMDLYDVLEMLMDWKAASERHANGNIVTSIELNAERFGISEQLKQIMLNTVCNYWLLGDARQRQQKG